MLGVACRRRGMGPRMREDTGGDPSLWWRGQAMRPRMREETGGVVGGYIRPGIFSPPVRLPSFWPAIS